MTCRALVLLSLTSAPVPAVFSGEPLGVHQGSDTVAVHNGDTNGDLKRDISDAIYLLGHVFLGGPPPVELLPCDERESTSVQNGDTNGDGALDVSDGIHLLGWLYSGGPEPVSRCASTQGGGAQATSFIVPLADTQLVPCANGGLGELVDFGGNFHMVIATTFDENGGGHLQFHTQPQNVLGLGTVTGDIYQVTGVEHNPIHFGSGVPLETSSQVVLNFVGRGSAVRFRVRLKFHLLITPNFTQPGRFLEVTTECN